MNEILEIDLAGLGVTTQFIAPVYTVVFSGRTAQINMPHVSTSCALALDADTAPWVFEATKRLDSLGRLRRNWDSYDGMPMSPNARLITFDALGWLKTQDLPVPGVVLGSDGTVHLEWRSSKGKELDVGFGATGTLEYAKMDNQGNIEEGETDVQIRGCLRALTAWLKTD